MAWPPSRSAHALLVSYIRDNPSSTRRSYARTVASLCTHLGPLLGISLPPIYNSVSHLCTRLASPPPTPAEIKPLLNTGLSRILISLPAPTTPEAIPLLALHWILRWTAARGADMLRCPVSALAVLPPRADVPACLQIVLPPCPTNRFLPPSAPRPAGGYKTDRSGFALDLVPIPCRLLPPSVRQWIADRLANAKPTDHLFPLPLRPWSKARAASLRLYPGLAPACTHHESWRRARAVELLRYVDPPQIRTILFGSAARAPALPTYLRGLPPLRPPGPPLSPFPPHLPGLPPAYQQGFCRISYQRTCWGDRPSPAYRRGPSPAYRQGLCSTSYQRACWGDRPSPAYRRGPSPAYRQGLCSTSYQRACWGDRPSP
eukprot:gene6618-6354_t